MKKDNLLDESLIQKNNRADAARKRIIYYLCAGALFLLHLASMISLWYAFPDDGYTLWQVPTQEDLFLLIGMLVLVLIFGSTFIYLLVQFIYNYLHTSKSTNDKENDVFVNSFLNIFYWFILESCFLGLSVPIGILPSSLLFLIFIVYFSQKVANDAANVKP